MLITPKFSCVAISQGLFPVSHFHVTSRCAGDGREHSQTASPSWPMEIFHTIYVILSLWMKVGQGAGLFLSLFCDFKSSLGQELKLFQEFRLFQKFHKIQFSKFRGCCSGTSCKLDIGWRENWIVYCLFCIFIIIFWIILLLVVLLQILVLPLLSY